MIQDHYQVLGITIEATDEDIRKAYRDLALKFHPDHNQTQLTHDRFVEIADAYRVLSEPESRRAYHVLYLKYFGSPDSSGNVASSYAVLTHARMKRATRYGRSMYSQRMRYRATGSFAHEPDREPARSSAAEESTSRQYSDYYQSRVEAEAAGAARGFGFYAQAVRGICLIISMFILFLVADRFFSGVNPAEKVEKSSPLPWSISEPGMAVVKTTSSEVHIHSSFVHMLPPGKEVRVEKTPFLHIPVRMFVIHEGTHKAMDVHGSIYGGGFYLSLLVLCAALVTVFVPKNPEFNAYLGTVTIVLAVIILGAMLS